MGELEKEGVILKTNVGEYCTPAQAGAVCGIIQGNERGFAFLIPDGKTGDMKDLFIPATPFTARSTATECLP